MSAMTVIRLVDKGRFYTIHTYQRQQGIMSENTSVILIVRTGGGVMVEQPSSRMDGWTYSRPIVRSFSLNSLSSVLVRLN
jgi:hypothetical protein